MGDPARPVLDIVIPVYNEGANILACLDRLERHLRTPYRVLICYDLDEDDTLAAIAARGPDPRIVTVKNDARGPHAAIMAGFRRTTAGAVLVFPADDVLNAGMLDAMVDAVRKGADIVAACRFMPGGSMEGCPRVKGSLVRMTSWTLHRLAGLPVRDATNGFRMFSRRVIESIPIESSRGFTYGIELTVKCHRLRWPMAEVPVVWRERTTGTSRFRLFRWLTPYLRWFFYAFATSWLRRRRVKGVAPEAKTAWAHGG